MSEADIQALIKLSEELNTQENGEVYYPLFAVIVYQRKYFQASEEDYDLVQYYDYGADETSQFFNSKAAALDFLDRDRGLSREEVETYCKFSYFKIFDEPRGYGLYLSRAEAEKAYSEALAHKHSLSIESVELERAGIEEGNSLRTLLDFMYQLSEKTNGYLFTERG